MPDVWLTCDYFVGKVSTMGQLSLPSLQGQYTSSNPCGAVVTDGLAYILGSSLSPWFRTLACSHTAVRSSGH